MRAVYGSTDGGARVDVVVVMVSVVAVEGWWLLKQRRRRREGGRGRRGIGRASLQRKHRGVPYTFKRSQLHCSQSAACLDGMFRRLRLGLTSN
jgi:hypothetical protein